MFKANIEKKATPLTEVRQFATNERTMCPALILAINRTVNVKGRIKILIVSISTKKGANTIGAPAGAKCAADALGLEAHPEIISNPQRIIAIVPAVHKFLVFP